MLRNNTVLKEDGRMDKFKLRVKVYGPEGWMRFMKERDVLDGEPRDPHFAVFKVFNIPLYRSAKDSKCEKINFSIKNGGEIFSRNGVWLPQVAMLALRYLQDNKLFSKCIVFSAAGIDFVPEPRMGHSEYEIVIETSSG